MLFAGCAKPLAPVAEDTRPIAFPGAEGFGKYTTGGRGGEVVIVTNLNDEGEGSFRKSVQKNGPRMIVFAVSGTIHLKSKLNIKGNVTIAGQTAPGDGICLADQPVSLAGDNIIIRYLRFRMGDRYQNSGKTPGSGGDDAFGGIGRKNIIIDHCTMSWSTDEAFTVYGGDSTTLQWNLIAEPLNYSYHFEEGDTDFEQHGFGGIWGGRHTSAHHNLFAHCVTRTPRFDGARNIPAEFVDFRNNVIYNWSTNNVYAGEGGRYNIVNNYYKPGPATKKTVQDRLLNPYHKLPQLDFGKFYVAGNVVEGAAAVTADNWNGVVMNKGSESDKQKAKMETAFTGIEVPTRSAAEGFAAVLQGAGASFHRDTLDARIISDVQNGKGKIIDVQGGYPHGTPYERTLTAWPTLKAVPPPVDGDKDGMPDVWEKENGLDPTDASDAASLKMHRYYTNVEVYLNSLVNAKQ
ncbi:MAG: pectate lyase [Chitinophagaceae bacterium]|nr:MAG: pectate lyase [Chitinophagaceae bacterium]